MKTLKQLLTSIAIVLTHFLFAQTEGTIKGTVTDEKGANLPFVAVALLEDSRTIASVSTDINGDFTFKQLLPGLYNLQIFFSGFKPKNVKNIEVIANQTSYVYKSLELLSDTLIEVVVVADEWEKPVINPVYSTITKIDIDQIENNPSGKSNVIALITNLSAAVMPTSDGKDIYIRGSRRGTTAYYIDGNRVYGSPDVVGLGIYGMEVLTGGMPAEYGDCTGGVVVITTKEYKTEMRRKRIEQTKRNEGGE